MIIYVCPKSLHPMHFQCIAKIFSVLQRYRKFSQFHGFSNGMTTWIITNHQPTVYIRLSHIHAYTWSMFGSLQKINIIHIFCCLAGDFPIYSKQMKND